MQIYNGTVIEEAGEPFDGQYGMRVSMSIQLSDPAAPKTQGGSLRLYKNPDSPDGRFMRTLHLGDAVQLIYTDNGRLQYYSFVTSGEVDVPQRATHQPPRQNSHQATYAQTSGQNTRIWLPLNDDQLVVMTRIVEQEIELIAHIMTLVHQRFGERLDEETLWKLSVTMYINADKKFNPNYIILDDQPDFEPDGGYSQDESDEIVF